MRSTAAALGGSYPVCIDEGQEGGEAAREAGHARASQDRRLRRQISARSFRNGIESRLSRDCAIGGTGAVKDLGLNASQLLPWFTHQQDTPYVLIRVSGEHVAEWDRVLAAPVRRCYVADVDLDRQATRTRRPNTPIIGPKKWRLKQDRTKPAPYSDVVHFVMPSWPQSSEQDYVLCSEVKTKSTPGQSSPVAAAIADCEKDRTSRLAKTLVWLKERSLHEDLGTTSIGQEALSGTQAPIVRLSH